jgi:hypothetical protein
VKTVDELMVGLARVTFGGAASVRIGQPRYYISTLLSLDQAFRHITTHGALHMAWQYTMTLILSHVELLRQTDPDQTLNMLGEGLQSLLSRAVPLAKTLNRL